LGTVTGMIRIFGSLSMKEAGNLSTLAGGISEVLMATAAGLVVAIPTRLIYHYFTTRVEDLARILEQNASALLGVIGRQPLADEKPAPPLK
jgi:biopolymer transport protein ExbB